MSDPVRRAVRDGVLEIVLDRPKANAIDAATSRRLGEVFADFRRDGSLAVAIVTATGDRFFSAGWDLKAAAASFDSEYSGYGPGGFAGLTEMFDLEKPVIAAVNGLAVGGGFELALACDLIVAAEHATFMLPETGIGIIPDAGGVLRLPRRLPHAIAMEMLLTGRRMPAAEAGQRGLVNAVVPSDRLLDAARALARSVRTAAPLAVRAVKQVVRGTAAMSVQEGFAARRAGAFPAYAAVLASQDAREGPRAFAEKRPPVWKGR
jgi:crotonobetainyl-CoA hydratase